ncbi:WD40-repeat-containing domain protein [Syncephalis pseudoplumigaleata]|uniref:WD40-repeat-containing domain protein n=1 Tax=Syncephalis pseudoplumigaleata TaxID=1712513 RepID=A0A4P9Z3P3_9FUNG|nr:WD40-repeat-containing domain protein [Syncephalis pseudoplumigaleata]|eukprot:RKP27045.1 WD40-repeat-containing domain protein [Syncephalis pseudoplumigaleata]
MTYLHARARTPAVNDRYASPSLVRRLEKHKELVGHRGCVNSLSLPQLVGEWTAAAIRLGRHAFMYLGCERLLTRVQHRHSPNAHACACLAGHRANIFSARFMPHTGDTVIACCAGDREIRVFDVHYSRSRAIDEKAHRRHVFSCHSSRVKRIAVEDDNPWSFLSCSEDGTVRHFDLRAPHNCRDDSCPSALLDLGRYGIELYGLSINAFDANYLALCGTSPFIYLYDRRMLKDGVKDCVQRFGPQSNGNTDSYVTALKFGTASRHELIGSWSDDAIYLFDIHGQGQNGATITSTGQRSRARRHNAAHTDSDHRRANTTATATSDIVMETPSDSADPSHAGRGIVASAPYESPAMAEGRAAFVDGDYAQCIGIFTRLIRRMNRRILRDAHNDVVFNWAVVKQRDRQRARCYQLRAIAYLFRSREAVDLSETLQYVNLALRDGTRAASLHDEDPRNWWIRAVCRWALVQHEDDGTRRDQMLTIAIEHAEKARHLLGADAGALAADIGAFVEEMNAQLQRTSADDSARKRRRSEGGDAWRATDAPQHDEQDQTADAAAATSSRDWIGAVATIIQAPAATEWSVSSRGSADAGHHSDEASSGLELSSNDDDDDDDESHHDEHEADDEDEDEEGGAVWAGHLSLPRTMLGMDDASSEDYEAAAGRGGDNSSSDEGGAGLQSSSDSDEESGSSFDEHVLRRFRYRPERYASRVPCQHEASSYKGHCNIATVKDVNFYGPRDEYIISGSDDGNFFIWSKSSGKLLQILEGDDDTVNVTEGHPFEPTLAVSGIDSTIKIFKPTADVGSVSEQMDNMEHIVESNTGPHQRQLTHIRFTQRMLAAVMSRMVHDRDNDEDEGLVPTCEVQ